MFNVLLLKQLKFDLANGLRSAFELMGWVEFSGSYPVGHQILNQRF
jgi:hypothetical protein